MTAGKITRIHKSCEPSSEKVWSLTKGVQLVLKSSKPFSYSIYFLPTLKMQRLYVKIVFLYNVRNSYLLLCNAIKTNFLQTYRHII